MACFMIGLVTFTLILTLISLKQLAHLLTELIKSVGSEALPWIRSISIIATLVVIVIVILFYFSIWRTNPMLRFKHMIGVLSLWTSGTLGLIAFMVLVCAKLAIPFLVLKASILSIYMAICFTPLPNFLTMFMDSKKLLFSLIIGVVGISLSWMIAYRIRAIHNLNVLE